MPGPEGDAELIALAVEALAAVGLPRPTIDLGHLGLAREVLSALALPEPALDEARRRIAKRDGAGLDDVLRAGARRRSRPSTSPRLLPELSGAPDVLDRRAPRGAERRHQARARRAGAPSSRAVEARRLDARLHVDLGEVRGFDYYTGVRFQAFVHGRARRRAARAAATMTCSARYGRPSPAVGFAVDVEAVAGALESRVHSSQRGTKQSWPS